MKKLLILSLFSLSTYSQNVFNKKTIKDGDFGYGTYKIEDNCNSKNGIFRS